MNSLIEKYEDSQKFAGHAQTLLNRLVNHDNQHGIFDEYNIDGNDRMDVWQSSELRSILQDIKQLWENESNH